MKTFTIEDVLNQSWGGPGFGSYEGRLDGEGAMDADARADAAMAMFGDDGSQQQGQDGQQQQDGRRQDGQQADGQQHDGQQQDGQQQSEPSQLTDEQLQGDPRYQELSTLKDSITNAFADFPGLIDDKGNINVQEAGLQLKDASVLYDIMQGKGTPSALLDIMANNAGWTDGQKKLIADDLIGWLTKGGYLKDGAAAPGKDPKAAGFKDPLTDRLDKLENDRKTEQQRAEQQRVAAHQSRVMNENVIPEIQRLCKQKSVPNEDFAFYLDAVCKGVAGNKAMIGRIEKANYVDLQRIFAGIYNSEAKRLERWTAAKTKAADAKNKNPKIPAGGAPPQPAGSAKHVNARNRDERIAAASEML